MIGPPEGMTGTPDIRVPPMDALSDVLRATRLSGGVFLQAEFTAPWCMEARVSPEVCAPFVDPVGHLIPYHYVVEGEFLAAVAGEAPLLLSRGETVLFPRNEAHLMGSDLGLPAVNAGDIIRPPDGQGLYRIRHGGGGAPTRIICGFLNCEGIEGNPLVSTLPGAMKLKAAAGPAEWIRSTFEYAANEVAAGRPGSGTVLAKLSELLFVEAVRLYVEDLPAGRTGWLAGLRDPVVARTLALMHGDMARRWSVDELGRQAGLSRSALAERFTRLIGMAPMQYLAHWRMQMAAQRLKDGGASLAQIADQVGYESEAAFSRAFKKSFGTAPATWRRTTNGD